MIDDFNLEQLIEPLQTWFYGNARELPWRSDPTPYHVWISEIMLQQTRVEAVKPYYARFMERLPDVQALAECPEDEYLKLWEGLGYYSRVRNLHAAAQQIMEQYGGQLPETVEELLKLKGIGSYTAGAISSIAYGHPVPAVDGNVLRVISRATEDDSDIMQQSVRSHMEKKLLELMKIHGEDNICRSTGNPGFANEPEANESSSAENKNVQVIIPRIFNQALMELGALVCLPNGAPRCGDCPWAFCCRALQHDRITELPVKKKAKERRIEERTVMILRDGEKVAIHRRPPRGLLAGLYELPNTLTHLTADQAAEQVRQLGYSPIRIQPLEPAKHIFSHVEWHMIGYLISVEEQAFADEKQKEKAAEAQLVFVEAADAREHYAIPNAFAAYAGYMNMK